MTMRYARHQPENAALAAREKSDRSRDTVAEEASTLAA
jgi:hypothetical protein